MTPWRFWKTLRSASSMTTLTPTSELALPGGSAPPGLPDVATLTRLAGEFFSALPGGTSTGPLTQGPQLPGTLAPGANVAPNNPQSVLSLGASTPSLQPHAAAPNGLPDTAVVAAPALDSRFGGQALGVPQVAAAPSAQPPSTPSTPYYFLGEASGYPSSPAVAAPRDDRVSAQSFGLPGADDLRALLSSTKSPAGSQSATAAGPGSSYYFVPGAGDSVGAPSAALPHQQAAQRPAGLDVNAVRRDFPILQERVNGKQLVWFDNAATTHKPQSVIDRLAWFYAYERSNIHRAAHELAARATDAYESAREKVRAFIGAGSVDELIFVRGATEAINLVAKTWGVQNVGEGDEIIVSNLEHHANIVPWQQLAAQKGARIRVIPVDDTGQVLLDEYRKLLNPRTKIVAVTQVSNALGTVVPVREIVAMAHAAGARALVDGAQSVSHLRVNVQEIGADFFVFSGHKIFGPTGIGVVYGRRELLDTM